MARRRRRGYKPTLCMRTKSLAKRFAKKQRAKGHLARFVHNKKYGCWMVLVKR